MEFNPFLDPFPMANSRPWTVEDLVSPLGKPNQPQKNTDFTLQLDSSSDSQPQEETVIPRVPGHCDMCLVDETPLWRGGPNGSKTLCNACGLRYSKEMKKVKLVLGEKGGKPQTTGDDPSDSTPKTKKPKKVKSGKKKKKQQ